MNMRYRISAGAAALGLLLCGSAGANEQEKEKSARASLPPAQQSQKADREQINSTPSVLVGDVVDVRNVGIKGQPSSHRLVKLELPNGKTAVVDAGSAWKAKGGLDGIERGDRVIAVGRTGRINDRPVLIAHSLGELHATGVTGSQRRH